jgi:CubicO group peptidase (beta-lactamase class C family)
MATIHPFTNTHMTTPVLTAAARRRLYDAMTRHVESGDLPGLVTLVSQHGEPHVDAIGTLATGGGPPMQRDTIFRISSMTKPITAAATLMLVDEGRLALDEPVERLLPELADRRVLRRMDSELDDTVPARRSITVRDLLTSRMGFGHPLRSADATPIQRAERDLGLMSLGPPKPATTLSPDEWLRRLATLPLMRQPGDAWLYATPYHVLGILVARAAQQPLGAFFRERLFAPLGMSDTGFSIAPDQQNRFATAYVWRSGAGSNGLHEYDDPADSQWGRAPVFPDAGAGLVSTVDDYFAFGQMLLDDGRHHGQQILSEASVRAMTTDHLSPDQRTGGAPILGDGMGYGFGVSITRKGSDRPGAGCRFGWDGGLGSSWASDSNHGVVGILMTQRMWASPVPPPVATDFWASVDAALAEYPGRTV